MSSPPRRCWWTPFLSWGGDLAPLHRSAVLMRSVHPVPDPGAVVTGRAVRGGTGYALLVVPSSPASSPPSVAYERHLLTLDLATGDVLGFRPVSLPSECLCRMYPDDDVVLVPLADAGPVAVQIAARPGPDDRSRFGLAIYT